MTTLRSPNGNCVAALQPAPGDLFTVTMLDGKLVFVRSADDYEKSLREAETLTAKMSPPGNGPFTVKVLGMSLNEVLALTGISREDFAASLSTPNPELRQLAERSCKDTLRRSNDPAVRADAMDLLIKMGVLQS